MKRKSAYLLIALVVCVAAVFVVYKKQAAAPQLPGQIIVTIGPENESGQSGNAVLSEVDGKAKVVLDLMGGPKDIMQPAHIHSGPCSDIGAVRYPLVFPVNGKSETMLEVSLGELRATAPLAINVHKSKEEITVYTACGDIVF